jgi:predicted TPR repeat methyltransferase
VERLCRAAGFDEVVIEELPALRLEGGQPLPGFLVTARPLAA